ncbi:hypothetical protein [Rothia nasisuis]|nr:hypothetical protein [Rothia nasisuis]
MPTDITTLISTEAMTELAIDPAARLADVQPGALTATLVTNFSIVYDSG